MHLSQRFEGRMVLIAALGAFLLTSPGSAEPRLPDAPMQPRECQAHVKAAKASLLRGDALRAHELVTRVLAQTPLSRSVRVEALLTLCAASFNRGQHAAAFAHCDQAEAIGGRSWRVEALRGMAHLVRGETEAAIDAFQAGLRHDSQRAVLRRGLRHALHLRYRPDAPVAAFGLAQNLPPRSLFD